jgi:catechol 2,3-dioxygenase-like lactoylglutathione lyase family enzyme
MTRLITLTLASFLAGATLVYAATKPATPPEKEPPLRLGNFSVSLNVKDLAASRAFYEKLGFKVIGGDPKNYLILQNHSATVGIFKGMFKGNILTFQPGWDRDTKPLADFDDVRHIQKTLTARGITLTTKAEEASTGPAYLTLKDPDNNEILIDQHVPAPKK